MRTFSFFLGLVAVLPCGAAAQRWEAGGSGGWAYVSEFEALPASFGVYARRAFMPAVALHGAVQHVGTEVFDPARLTASSGWYRRAHTSFDVGVRLAPLREGRQDFGVNVGLSLRRRDDLTNAGGVSPEAFEGRPGLLDSLVAACAAESNCRSRTVPARDVQPGQAGTYLLFARTQQGLSPGAFAELEYGLRFGRVRTALVAGARRYVAPSSERPEDGFRPEVTRWSGGLRLGYRF